jgi:hypothetical protein
MAHEPAQKARRVEANAAVAADEGEAGDRQAYAALIGIVDGTCEMAMTRLRIETARVFRPLLEPARYKGAYGGRGSGKSHFFGELMVEECLMDPGTLAVCIREVQKSLM